MDRFTVFSDWTNILSNPQTIDLVRTDFVGPRFDPSAPKVTFPFQWRYEERILSLGVRFRLGGESRRQRRRRPMFRRLRLHLPQRQSRPPNPRLLLRHRRRQPRRNAAAKPQRIHRPEGFRPPAFFLGSKRDRTGAQVSRCDCRRRDRRLDDGGRAGQPARPCLRRPTNRIRRDWHRRSGRGHAARTFASSSKR